MPGYRLGYASPLGSCDDESMFTVADRSRRVPIGVGVAVCLTVLYVWGWGPGIAAAVRDLAGTGPVPPGIVTVRGQLAALLRNLLLTLLATIVFLTVRRRACGFLLVRRWRVTWPDFRRWWRTGFAYCFCMLAGFMAIDAASALLRTRFYDYPFAVRFEAPAAAVLYLANMFMAGPTEELVLLGIVVIGFRHAGMAWWAVICVAVALRVPFHLYYGWAAFAIGIWPVLSVLLFRRTLDACGGMITPFIVAHGMYDLTTALANLDAYAGSPWPRAVALGIVAMPVSWGVSWAARQVLRLFGSHRP